MRTRTRASIGFGLMLSTAALSLSLAQTGGASVPAASAASQIAAFSKPASLAAGTALSAGDVQKISTDFAQVDPSQARTFALGDATGFKIIAAPTADGGICFANSLSGGACIGSFSAGGGMIIEFGPAVGLDHAVASGIVPDGVTAVRIGTRAGQFSGRVNNNTYRVDLAKGLAPTDVTSYSYLYADGTEVAGAIDQPGAARGPVFPAPAAAAARPAVVHPLSIVQFWWYSASNYSHCWKDGDMFFNMTCQSPGYAPRSYIHQTSLTYENHDLRYYYTSGAIGGQATFPSTINAQFNAAFSYGLTYGYYYGHDGHNDDTTHTTTG